MSERVQASNKKPEAKRENRPSQTLKTGPSQSISSPVDQILFLQRTIGNQAVGKLIKSGALQAKLSIGQPGDIYEQEADRVAEQVMRMPDAVFINTAYIQRECPKYEEEEEELQAKATSGSISEVNPDLESHIHSLKGGGQYLSENERAFFEPRFDYDFNNVLVHTESKAAESAHMINARAYTMGQDVVFGEGHYAPNTTEGRRLLAHELTHVIQQSHLSSGISERIMRQKGKAAKKVVGWIVKVGERKLIKRASIYTEKEVAKLLGKGYNILVRDGYQAAKRISKKVWGDNMIHHTGHIIKKTGKQGISHFQPGKHLFGKPGEKGWHIFYSVIPILFFSDNVEAMEIYDDKYPGKSIANYLTVTHYVGEGSWLSYLDWVNPLELIAIGGDIGRNLDRERTKELKAIIFNRVSSDGTVQTYEMDPEGQLVRVIVTKPDGKKKILSDEEYFTLIARQVEKSPQKTLPQDGIKHSNYASTFDSEYRIYISKRGWNYDSKTLSFFLPKEDAQKLKRIGQYYVMEDFSIKYVYAHVHPRYRQNLREPGFLIPENLVEDYASSQKTEYLRVWLEKKLKARELQYTDLWQGK